jgi:hypothetical protein
MFLANEIEFVWSRQRDYFFQNILNPWLEKNITVNAIPDIVNLEKRSVIAYSKQMNRCRKAVDTWTLVGLRFRVVKDIRNLIAKLIWESRNEEIYF